VTDLFFYGTLQHFPLLEIVLGKDPAGLDICPAALPEHAVLCARPGQAPQLLPKSGTRAPGLLFRGPDAEDIARISYYAGATGCGDEAVEVALDTGTTAKVVWPGAGQEPPSAPWALEDWVARQGALSCRVAREVMGYYGSKRPEEVAVHLPSIRLRAAAWMAAQARPADPERDLSRDVVVHGHSFAHMTFYGLEETELQFRRHDGTMSPRLNRSALMTGQAAVILPYDPVHDTVLLIEQFRVPVYLSGDRAPWVWEPVAGMVDPGETPEATARREAMEEAGLALRQLEKVGGAYSSTGSSAEYVYLYVGLADLTQTTQAGGLEEEGENIRSAILPFHALMAGIDECRYRNLQLISIALWLARHRNRLRKNDRSA